MGCISCGDFSGEITSYIKHLELFRLAYIHCIYIYIYYTGCRKKKTLEEEKVTIKIEGCGAKFYHRNDLGVPDPA